MTKYSQLKLENQICFPLYACAKGIVKKYTPILEPFKLTYTQYIVMMVLWEQEQITVSDLGKRLFLDSGTLTPVLKKLELNGYVKRSRQSSDERCVAITLTDQGHLLQDNLKDVPQTVGGCVNLTAEEATTLYSLLYKVLGCL